MEVKLLFVCPYVVGWSVGQLLGLPYLKRAESFTSNALIGALVSICVAKLKVIDYDNRFFNFEDPEVFRLSKLYLFADFFSKTQREVNVLSIL